MEGLLDRVKDEFALDLHDLYLGFTPEPVDQEALDRSVADLKVSSVRKKWKDKAFAAAVDRTEIEHAAADLGVPLDEHIGVVLQALQAIAPTLSLDGSLVK